ncbi:MAG: hypothetical protein KO464_01750 [Candidatus Methanofastidiosum sp.]|nr:hypothetical protein [Methanofastidiosum sp.]
MRKYLSILLIITTLLIFSACVSNSAEKPQTNTQPNTNQGNTNTVPEKVNVLKVEVIHFHPRVGCVSCTTLGAYTEETVNKYFSKELQSGRITFRHVNYELTENQELVLLYRPPGSALCIGVYDDQGHLFIEENYGGWYRLNNKDTFFPYMKQLIEMRLNGDLTKI